MLDPAVQNVPEPWESKVSRQFAETEFPETADGVRPPELDALEAASHGVQRLANSHNADP